MAVLQDSAQRGLVPRFLDVLGNVELRQNVLINGSFRADDIDIEVLPSDAQFLSLEPGGQVSFVLLLNLREQAPVIVLTGTRAAVFARGLITHDRRRTLRLIFNIDRPSSGR